MKKTKPTIFSLGHSNVSIWVFTQKLKENKIKILVDVRTIPLSRFCPHFSQKPLQKTLASENILYLYRGRNLGGRGVNTEYEETIDEVVDMVKRGEKVCVLCSEKDYRKCHRYTLLTPSFEERGVTVFHIEYENENKTTKHSK
ncbi:MAG: hypothetical protein UU67_C0051G0005 [Candidatus Daviesbacteria bacterium GW2011_GWB1_41_5]|uniref:DUF488 domain-containing protein n=1 Tax=Candidatus Daviesbacteria bacterium GW2011_GWB1_41_5 TaxID=1618429 RepID=A0A0G0YS75_9BACT|nr:MAG: hypothetical protein UU67_C0051G0005 [Candidatus Daviesbacteria bacterium GW2011_GWB1_41_5]